jgi:hypothetical protein
MIPFHASAANKLEAGLQSGAARGVANFMAGDTHVRCSPLREYALPPNAPETPNLCHKP